jgi:uncharacterized protein (DUF885 family)
MEVAETTLPQTTLAPPTAFLADLPFDEFLEASYLALLRRDPERVTELELTQVLGIPNNILTDISDVYVRETQALESAALVALRAYNRAELTESQKLSYDIYAWYLEDRVQGHKFMYYDYPVTHFLTGIQNQQVHFFTDLHPIRNKQEVEDYIDRLWLVEPKFDQLMEGLWLRQEAGVVLPQFLLHWITNDLRRFVQIPPDQTPFYAALEDKISNLEDIELSVEASLLAAAEKAVEGSVLPAYRNLLRFLEEQERIAPREAGVWRFSEGEAYYEYILKHHTTTDLTPVEIHEIGLRELERIHQEMRERFARLGYPEGESLTASFARVAVDSGSLSGPAVVEGYEKLIQEMDDRLDQVFSFRPEAEVVVLGGPSGGFYIAPARDGSRPGAFYASNVGSTSKFGMPTLAYHEAVPGHHMQIAIAQELELPGFRRGSHFTAYNEGWALYAERLAWEMGLYEEDPYGDLGRLQAEAFRAARLVVDTGVHSQGWDFEEAVEFMVENTGLGEGFMRSEVSRYITWPGQAAAYMTGMLEILALRALAQESLGEQFDLPGFHNIILGEGSMPLGILKTQVESSIAAALLP